MTTVEVPPPSADSAASLVPTVRTGTRRPVPLWAERVAHLIPLVVLPQCLWRLPIGFGYEMGLDLDGTTPGLWVTIPYVFGLSILTECLALLGFGLVRGWGEVFARWLPFIGGRRVPPRLAVTVAAAGGLAATLLWGTVVLGLFGIVGGETPTWSGWDILAMACITPALAWGPLVLALAYAYRARRADESSAGRRR